METAKKKKRRNILFAIVAVLLILLLTALPFLLEKNQQREKSSASVLSAKAEIGTIRKTLSGTGTLTEQDAEDVSVPDGVNVTEYLVENGQFVKQGDPVAVVDKTSVMETISSLSETMGELETEMESIRSSSDYTYINAPAAGRVKAVYAAVGDAVQDVLLKHGALAVLSLDGLMAVHFPAAEAVRIGQSVTVVLTDGTETPGRVETVIDGEATVTFSDEYGSIGDSVSVRSADGQILGSGTLYVHSAWNAIATGGTVSSVYVEKDRVISIYGAMLLLKDTAAGGEYEELAATHREYEETMADLFRMLQDGYLAAPCEGCVSGVDNSILKSLSAEDGTYRLVFLSDDSMDDPGYYSLTGVVTGIGEDGLTLTVLWLDTGTEASVSLDTVQYIEGEIKENYYCIFNYDSTTEPNILISIYATEIPYSEREDTPDDDSREEREDKPEQEDGKPSGGGMTSGMGGSGGGGALPSGSAAEDTSVSSVVSTTILSVTPHETVSVNITVDELDILYVHTGQQAQVTLDALQGQAFTGTITAVNTIASNEGGNSKYSAVVELERTAYMLGGMNASANITIEERDNVLLIPAEALNELDSRSVVYTAYDAKTETLSAPVAVEIGLSDGKQVQILSGLLEGDSVWYRYYDTLEIQGLSGGFPSP